MSDKEPQTASGEEQMIIILVRKQAADNHYYGIILFNGRWKEMSGFIMVVPTRLRSLRLKQNLPHKLNK